MAEIITFFIIIIPICYFGFYKASPVLFWIFIIISSVLIIAKVISDKKSQQKAEIERLAREEQKRKLEEERKRILELERQQREQMYEEARRNRKMKVEGWKAEFKKQADDLPLFEIVLSDEKHNRNNSIFFEDKCKNMTKSTPLNKIKDFIAVDVETTGLKTGGNDIIQLSAVKFNNFRPVQAFNTYIKPRKPIPEDATKINGITDEMVENAPKFYQIIDSFNQFIENLPLVAHNAPFDMKHLYVNGLDSVEDKIIYDTLSLSRRIMKDEDSYHLEDICESADIYMTNAHNSLYDSYATGLLFVYLVAERREISVDELLE
ncbi:MAG: hypothetical protein K2J08_05380 [Ruminococcus sp.]|nr:hypothetical protein [Ruminococcus sp.]